MKVTALLSDQLISDVRRYTKGKTTTEALQLALEDWVALQRTRELNAEVRRKPLEFAAGFSAKRVRERSRRRS